MLKDVAGAIAIVQSYETGDSAYVVANRLRGLTKVAYTSGFWSVATGSRQRFVRGDLDGMVLLAGEMTDFGHFIAALSDQIEQPGVGVADLTRWTADHTSWAGDLGSAIVTYYRSPEKFVNLEDALGRFASESDQAANIAAFLIGREVNQGGLLSEAIARYDDRPFAEHVRGFCRIRFGEGDLGEGVRGPIASYLKLASDSGLYGWMKGVVRGRFFPRKQYAEGDVDRARDYFLGYLGRRG